MSIDTVIITYVTIA